MPRELAAGRGVPCIHVVARQRLVTVGRHPLAEVIRLGGGRVHLAPDPDLGEGQVCQQALHEHLLRVHGGAVLDVAPHVLDAPLDPQLQVLGGVAARCLLQREPTHQHVEVEGAHLRGQVLRSHTCRVSARQPPFIRMACAPPPGRKEGSITWSNQPYSRLGLI